MTVIPFYGTERPDLFALERLAMDVAGKVIRALDDALPPSGTLLDVGAGDGFAAARLSTGRRRIIAMEPADAMIDRNKDLDWVRGDAEALPFSDGSFDGAYATWAYFFSREWDPSPGLGELHRAVRAGGPIVIVDNLGDDEFTALAHDDITADPDYWLNRGFTLQDVNTHFAFETLADARTLLGWYFGERGIAEAATTLSYRVGLFQTSSLGPNPRPLSGPRA